MTITRIRNMFVSANPWAALRVLLLGSFMALLDLTIVNIAIPSILAGLHASLDEILWVLNAYSLVFTLLLITAARLGDRFGPRTIFALGLAIFTVGSAGSGLAPAPIALIISVPCRGQVRH